MLLLVVLRVFVCLPESGYTQLDKQRQKMDTHTLTINKSVNLKNRYPFFFYLLSASPFLLLEFRQNPLQFCN